MWTHRRSGLMHQRGENDHRDSYERDRTRVIHCPAFRRLQRKTQILGTDGGDFHRTRLTHSLEVASIGISIGRSLLRNPESASLTGLLPNDDLLHVICLLHDIGHPPFGHGGEVALNYRMREHGGFEGNGQTIRLLTKVEDSYGPYGLDLTRRTLLGILKYPVPYRAVVGLWSLVSEEPQSVQVNDWIPPKGYFDCEQTEIDWLLSAFSEDDRVLFQSLASTPSGNQHGRAAFHAFDCSIMDIADDIAYGVHDLEDAIHLHLIERDQLDTPDFKHLYAQTTLSLDQSALLDGLFSRELSKRKQAIGELVNYFITAVRIEVTHPAFQNQLLHYNAVLAPEARGLLDYLIRMIYQHVIDSPEARISEHGGQMVVSRLFEAISANPHALLDMKSRSLYAKAEDKTAALRVVCDFIACMTDEFAYSMHQRLLGLNTRRFG